MDNRLKLDVDMLSVQSFPTLADPAVTSSVDPLLPIGQSWPECGTCIDICAPTEDIRCR